MYRRRFVKSWWYRSRPRTAARGARHYRRQIHLYSFRGRAESFAAYPVARVSPHSADSLANPRIPAAVCASATRVATRILTTIMFSTLQRTRRAVTRNIYTLHRRYPLPSPPPRPLLPRARIPIGDTGIAGLSLSSSVAFSRVADLSIFKNGHTRDREDVRFLLPRTRGRATSHS